MSVSGTVLAQTTQRGSAAWRPAPSSVTLLPARGARHVCLFTSLDTGAGQPCVHAGVGLPCAGWATEAGLSPRFPGGRGAATLHSGAAPWPLQRIWGLLDTRRGQRVWVRCRPMVPRGTRPHRRDSTVPPPPPLGAATRNGLCPAPVLRGPVEARGSAELRLEYRPSLLHSVGCAFVLGYKSGFSRLRPVQRKCHRKLLLFSLLFQGQRCSQM